ncbi:MAG: dimethylsulfonioproprionate lyase family protein [Paracoccaceae bacterium]
MITPVTPDDFRALEDLRAPCGQPGSGRVRYAAAMYFNRSRRLSDAALEVFRICSPLDHEDPAGLLTTRGLLAEVQSAAVLSAELSVRLLIDEADTYLATLSGPGIAEVRSGISYWRGAEWHGIQATRNSVVDTYLPAALAPLEKTHASLAKAIRQTVPHLQWITYDEYPAAEIGPDFPKSHAYATLIGEKGAPIRSNDWDMGIFLIAPNVLYRDHRHKAPELYAPLTGPHGWRFAPDAPVSIFPAHHPVWNEPFAAHMTKVGPTPFLCLYIWTRDVNEPAEVLRANDWADLQSSRLEV